MKNQKKKIPWEGEFTLRSEEDQRMSQQARSKQAGTIDSASDCGTINEILVQQQQTSASSILSWESLDRELASKEMQVQQSKEPAGEKKSKSWLLRRFSD